MTTIRRSKTMPTEGHATRFLYTILKQLDLKSIDWSLVATELDISNGHAARMRYSRFKQQMEGATTTTVSKTTKSKKANAKTDLGRSIKQSTKGKNPYDKRKNFDDGKCGSSSYAVENNLKKRLSPDDFIKQDKKMMGSHGFMSTEQMNNFPPVMFDPFMNAASYWTPSAGTLLSTDSSTFPYMMSMPDLQHQKQQQFPIDPFANMYIGQMPQVQNGEDMSMSLSPGWVPQKFDQMFSKAAQYTESTNTAPTSTAISAISSEWNNHTDFCFSGCCQQPPPYPATPSLHPDVPSTDRSGDSLMSGPPTEPWVPPPQQNQWVPIKPEPGEDGDGDDIFVKIEADA